MVIAFILSSLSLQPEVTPLRSRASADSNGVLVWADTKLWRYAPQDAEAWVTIIGIDLLNTNDQPVEFRLQDIHLVDNHGRRAAPFFIPSRSIAGPITVKQMWQGVNKHPPITDDIESLIKDGPDGVSSVFVVDDRRLGFGAFSFREAYGIGNAPTDWNPDEIRYIRTPNALNTRAIFNRVLEPGKKAHGYLAFPRPAEDASRIWLVWNGAQIPFRVIEK